MPETVLLVLIFVGAVGYAYLQFRLSHHPLDDLARHHRALLRRAASGDLDAERELVRLSGEQDAALKARASTNPDAARAYLAKCELDLSDLDEMEQDFRSRPPPSSYAEEERRAGYLKERERILEEIAWARRRLPERAS